MPEISVTPISAPESSSGASFVVRLSSASSTDVSVTMLLQNGTADIVNDVDVDSFFAVRQEQVVTFAAGEVAKTVTLYHKQNNQTGGELDESYVVEFFNPVGATFSGGKETLRITNVIEDNGLALFVSDPRVLEGNSGQKNAVFEVQLSRVSASQVVLDFETKDGTARAGEDFQFRKGQLTFDPGETVKLVSVPIIGDRIPEVSETFTLYVSPAAGDSGAIQNPFLDATGDALLIDEDTDSGDPVLTVERVQGIESSAGEKIIFRLSEPATQDVTFTASLFSETAETSSDVDFDRFSAVRTEQVVTIKAGESATWIYLYHNQNGGDAADEQYLIELSKIDGAVFAGDSDTLTTDGVILDGGRSVFVSDPRVLEGDDGRSIAQFEVRLSQPAKDRMVFDYNTLNGTALAGSDYVAKNGRLVFLPGETVKFVDVAIKGDRVSESDETFSLRIEATPATDDLLVNSLADNVGVMTIRNDDRVLPEIKGNKRDNTLDGTNADERLIGLGGKDELNAGGGDDELFGGAGRDILAGGLGADLIDGGAGFDLADYSDSGSRIVVNMLKSQFSGGDADGDTVLNIEGVIGTDFNDLLKGSAKGDRLDGLDGNDRIKGLGGNDVLNGGDGRDKIKGGAGDDTIAGGADADRLVGEDGKDTFVFNTGGRRDKIQDFKARDDTISLHSDLVDGLTTGAEVVAQFASIVGDDILLNLKGGTSVVVVDFDNLTALGNSIEIF